MTFFKKKIFKYILQFGVWNGLQIFFKVRRGKKEIVCFKIPRLPMPVFLRRFSSDFVVFEEIFIDEIYKINYDPSFIGSILDAGANVGMAALYFLRQFPEAKIVCVEPEEKNYELLCKNLHSYKNVSLVKKGLWSHKAYLMFKKKDDLASWGFEVMETTKELAEIEAISVNELMYLTGLERFDLCKIDIEGSEKEVFEANTSWLAGVAVLIIKLHENMREGSGSAVLKKMESLNYTVKMLDTNYLFIRNNMA